ncbi:glutathione S-transferase family protein [Novosphingobium sp. BL-52-GroH]|uniref:glutathione S-transferase family protein n=1 Tax=Novosphingobium sp. BL-52-GroH TaxID=3349877 RepID=UPI00384CA49A
MMTLYTADTGNGHRASIMLEEAGLPYDVVAIDFAAGEHRGEALLAVNPMGQIPALVDPDGFGGEPLHLGESAAILRHLARKSGKLLPEGGAEECEADRWTAILAGGLQSAPTTIFFARLSGLGDDAGIIAKQFEVIGRYLAIMEARLAASAYLAGARMTYVDILGFTLVNGSLPRFGVDLGAYPAILAWRDGIAARPAVQRGLAVPG